MLAALGQELSLSFLLGGGSCPLLEFIVFSWLLAATSRSLARIEHRLRVRAPQTKKKGPSVSDTLVQPHVPDAADA